MRKSLQDVALYLTEILVPKTYENYAINPVYTEVIKEEEIHNGILEFRTFLIQLYHVLYLKGEAYDTCKKVAHEYENRTTLSVYYPFLHNVSVILMKIGYYGRLIDHGQTISCDYKIMNDKLTVTKNLENLRFLVECGIRIEGIDLHDKKQNLSDIKTIKITYPKHPAMLSGLKIMAIAEVDHRSLDNQDVFLRCDYRVLKKDDTDVFEIVQDTIKPLPSDIQAFILALHQRYTSKGFQCVVETKGFHIYIKYTLQT